MYVIFLQKYQVSGGIYHLLFTFVSALNVIKEALEVIYHIGRRYNLCHLTEAAEPSIELVTDCDFCIHNEVPLTIGIVGYICACAEAVNHGVQKVVGEPQAHTLLLTTEHSKMLLGVGFHVDLGELQTALSWFVRNNIHALHTIQAIGHGCVSPAVPCQNIVVTIVDYQLEGADFVSSATPTINLLRAVFDGEFLIAEFDFPVLSYCLIDCQHCAHDFCEIGRAHV